MMHTLVPLFSGLIGVFAIGGSAIEIWTFTIPGAPFTSIAGPVFAGTLLASGSVMTYLKARSAVILLCAGWGYIFAFQIDGLLWQLFGRNAPSTALANEEMFVSAGSLVGASVILVWLLYSRRRPATGTQSESQHS